nr:integrase, catalytic region, zinc finger, CCHC-type, peptidase aspartic, catalytic [Tanacetum cinerariifolium]
KLQPKADIGIFIGYAPTKKAFRIYNRHTRRIVETIHVNFDELTAMASEQSSSVPEHNEMTLATISLRLSENLGKLQPKADIGIFIGYAPTKKAFRIYNRHTRRIVETIHVNFDELTAMASEQSSSVPEHNEMTLATISLRL